MGLNYGHCFAGHCGRKLCKNMGQNDNIMSKSANILVVNREAAGQEKESEWFEQWSLFQDDEKYLFEEWIYPNSLEDFVNKTVLDCGCGGGQHIGFCAPFAKKVVGVDLNTSSPLAIKRNKKLLSGE